MTPLSGIILAGDSWFSDDPGVISQIQNATRSTVTNMGVGGSRSADTLQRLNDFISGGGSFAPGSVVVLNVGGNDFLSGIDRSVTKNNLDQILSLLDSQGVKTVLSGAPSVNSVDDITSGKDLAVDPIYKEVAAKYKNATLVDSMASLLSQPNLRTPDNIHLTNEGQLQFVETLLKGIGTAQKPTTTPSRPAKPAAKPAAIPTDIPRATLPNIPAEPLPEGLQRVIYSPKTGLASVAPQQIKQTSEAGIKQISTPTAQPTGISQLVQPQTVTPQPLTSTITETRLTTPTEARGVETFQQAEPMAFTNEQIANYIATIQASGGTNVDIAKAMDEFKISPSQVSAATNVPVANIQTEYNRVNPTGIYAIQTAAPATTTTTTTAPATPTGIAQIANTQFTNQNIVDYIKAIQASGGSNSQIASEMDRLRVPPSQVAPAIGMSVSEVQNMYNSANPRGIYSTAGATTPTTLTPTTPAFTPQQISDYVKQMQSLGRSEAEIAAEMDRFGVNVKQMAEATGVSPVVIQDMYNVARPKGKYSTVLSKEGIAGFERPEYEPVTFTGQTAPALPVVIPTAAYTTRELTGGPATGSPIASSQFINMEPAPAPYGGVPAAPARPAANYPAPTTTNIDDLANYVNFLQGAGGTSTDLTAAFNAAGVTPDQAALAQEAAVNPGTVATPMKEGGLASLAQKVQSAGRHGDTMLAHINPREAGILQALGGAGTINPRTGLPEFFNPLKELKRAGRSIDRAITQPVIKGLNTIAEKLGPVGQIAAAMFGGPIGAAVYAGFAAPGGDFDLRRATTAGALTYVGGQMLGGAPAGGEGAFTATGGEMAYPNIADAGTNFAPPVPGPEAMLPVSDTLTTADLANQGITLPPDATAPSGELAYPNMGNAPSTTPGPSTSFEYGYPEPTDAAPSFRSVEPTPTGRVPVESPSNLAGSIYDVGVEGAKAVGIDTLPKAALAATLTASGISAKREQDRFKAEQARVQQELAARRQRQLEQAQRTMGMYPIRFAAEGGMMDEPDNEQEFDFAEGGMPPRFLSGGGDGMSDSIPATIGDKQPARLADGEFVIPADVVSHLGNGSSKAGAKQLYSMMDRIRQARTGTKKQGKEVNPRRFMPA